jgi:RHS repeat-associated protein
VTANSSGTKTAELRYKAWGETRYTSGTTLTTIRYTGQREESSFGLYYYGARWYDSALGRWNQPDTIIPTSSQGTQAWDRMAYVNNNPINHTDPTGHTCEGLPDGARQACEAANKPASTPPLPPPQPTATPTATKTPPSVVELNATAKALGQPNYAATPTLLSFAPTPTPTPGPVLKAQPQASICPERPAPAKGPTLADVFKALRGAAGVIDPNLGPLTGTEVTVTQLIDAVSALNPEIGAAVKAGWIFVQAAANAYSVIYDISTDSGPYNP